MPQRIFFLSKLSNRWERYFIYNKNTKTSVTTKDIKIYNKNNQLYPEEFHKKVFPKNKFTKDNILITKLRPNIYNNDKGEELDIVFKGSKNNAKAHARWSPVSCCTLSNIVDEKEAAAALALKVADTALSPKDKEAIKKQFNSLDKYRYFLKNKYGEASAFHFKIESENGLEPSFIFEKAFEILIEKLVSFKENLEASNGVTIHTIHDNQHFYQVVISDEDFTLLNVLQCIIYNKEIRENPSKTLLEYIGYHQPHPLDNKMVLKVKYSTSVDLAEFLSSHVTSIIDDITKLKDKWMKTV